MGKTKKQKENGGAAGSPLPGVYPMNYDAVFKDAMTLFKDKTLDFLGVHGIAPIDEPLSTENVDIEVKTEFADLTFSLKDGRGAHYEEEVSLSHDDLLRFCEYHIWLSRAHKREFITVIFVKDPVTVTEVNWEQLRFAPKIVDCSKINADETLARLKRNIAQNAPVNELEVLYLPLFHSETLSATALFKESAALIKTMHTEDKMKMKLYALSMVLVRRIVDPAELEALWEEVKRMGNVIIEFAESYGEKRGIKIGEKRGEKRGIQMNAEETARKMAAKGYDIQDIVEMTGVSLERLKELLSDAAV